MAGPGNSAESAFYVPRRVNAKEVLERRFRCFAALEPSKIGAVEGCQRGAQSRRRFRMMRSGVVFETGRVRIEKRRHRQILAAARGEVSYIPCNNNRNRCAPAP